MLVRGVVSVCCLVVLSGGAVSVCCLVVLSGGAVVSTAPNIFDSVSI